MAAASSSSSDSESDEEAEEDLSKKPIGPADPSKCMAAGAGIAGGTACAASSFVVTTKDADGRKCPIGGAQIKVKVSPGVGVGGTEQEGVVKDMGDGTYTVTYVVPKRGNYMVNIECNGKPIMGSPFPVFFSAGATTTAASGGLLGLAPASTYPNLVNQTMPNMPNYSASVSGAFPGLLGMIPGVIPGASGGAILPGIGASLGEVCREYLNGRCAKTDCKLNHPPHNLLMTALAATTSMGTVSQVPMAPSAAAMAAAQAIVAAQALQAHAAQVQAQAQSGKDSSASPDKAGKDEALKRTLQVSNLSPLLTVEQLKQLFSFCGTVVDCTIADSKYFAHIEYAKPEEATAALALNNMDVGGRPMNVEMAKSLPQKPAILNSQLASSSLPLMMQQAVAMQQMQFQQALLMQQNMTAQQAANRAATMKSATELAAARAAEISRKLKADGLVSEEKEEKEEKEEEETKPKSRSPSPSRKRSRSKSRSPISYHRRRRSPSYSPPSRFTRDRRSRSPLRSRYYPSRGSERRSYRDIRDSGDHYRRRGSGRSRDHHLSSSRKQRSRSVSPRTRKSYRVDSVSPKRHWESTPRRATRADSRSPSYSRGNRSSPRIDDEHKLKHRKRSRSISPDGKYHSNGRRDETRHERSKHRERRRSRSMSTEDKHHKRSSARSTDENKSKHRRRSRSKSLEGKHRSVEEDTNRDDKSKRRGRRRSRSKSLEMKQLSNEKVKETKKEDSKHDERRRSRSRSNSESLEDKLHSDDNVQGARDEKSKRHDKRRSRSRSVESNHKLKVKVDDDRSKRPKHRGRRRSRSVSFEAKHHRRSRSSSRSSGESKMKHRRHSRSNSPDGKNRLKDELTETRDEKSKSRGRKSRSNLPESKLRRGSSGSQSSSDESESKNIRRPKSDSVGRRSKHEASITEHEIGRAEAEDQSGWEKSRQLENDADISPDGSEKEI